MTILLILVMLHMLRLHETLAKLRLSEEIQRKKEFEEDRREKERMKEIEANKAAARIRDAMVSQECCFCSVPPRMCLLLATNQ